MSTVLHLSGVPTEPDVKRLREKFGVPAAGTIITRAQISEVIKVASDDRRFKTVVGAWRGAMEREHCVRFIAVPKVGFQAMTENQKNEAAVKESANKMRGQRRAYLRLQRINVAELSDANKALRERTINAISATMAAWNTSVAKQLADATAPRLHDPFRKTG